MVLDCKQDMRRKVRFVASSYLIDLLDNKVYSSTVKGTSVKLLHILAHKVGLDVLCGDICNAYANAFTTKKVYTITGIDIESNLNGKVVVIQKALYGLATLCLHFHYYHTDSL
eukprot:224931-Ditylum_brightwellii.AAC.1